MARKVNPKTSARWRIQVTGPERARQYPWFTPAAEGVFSDGVSKADIEAALLRLLHSYYPPLPGDTISVSQVLRRERGRAPEGPAPRQGEAKRAR